MINRSVQVTVDGTVASFIFNGCGNKKKFDE